MTPFSPIAIVGVSALFPGSCDATGFWRDILAGRDLLTDVPPGHWLIDDYFDADPNAPDKTYARRGGFIDPVGFDALGFGIPPSLMPATDTAQLLALIVAQSVLQDAVRERFEHMDRSRISVILGVTSAQELLFSMVSRLQKPVWVKALREAGLDEPQVQDACQRIADHYVPWQEASFPGLLGNVVAGRIANRLNLGGTNCVTDAACASALSALSMAVNELQLGHSDLVISGGVDTLNDIFMYMCFSKTPALSPSGDCRPFAEAADGTMLGEGLGMVALKRLQDAERDGDRVYAVIRGLGTASDGRSKSVYAPVSEGQARALSRTYAMAGYGPETVELMEAHGTGTKAGDIAEFEGLRQVFGNSDGTRAPWCALGSVKSQIGHTKAAAGAAGLFKAVMALQHKVLPPTIKIDTPNPKLAIERSAFYLNTQARPWIRSRAHPRRASVSAFGFGGSNFHLTLEEYTGTGQRAERLPMQHVDLVMLSADSSSALILQARALLETADPLDLLARRSRAGFNPRAPYRLAWVASTVGELRTRLATLIARIASSPDAGYTLPDGSSYGVGEQVGKLALLFPGQGSQYLGMGADIAMQFDTARAVWDSAADLVLADGSCVHQRMFPPPRFAAAETALDQQRLTATECAQPAIGAHSLALHALLSELGIEADMVGGHSFGEVIALHAGGVLDQADALRVAAARGARMAEAARTPGAMSALNMPVEQVLELIAHSECAVVVANHNAPLQVVVSGSRQAIEDFDAYLTAQGHTSTRLPVASGFHSSVVEHACAPFAADLAAITFAAPTLPVYANADGRRHDCDAAAIRATLAAQIARPVQFVSMIERMYRDGARCFVEVGPGSVLCGLVKAILGDRPHQVIALDRKHKDGVESLLIALAKLSAAGIPWQSSALFADVRLAPSAPAHGRPLTSICGSNLGKPYPPEGGSAALPPPNVGIDLTTPSPRRAPGSILRAGEVQVMGPGVGQDDAVPGINAPPAPALSVDRSTEIPRMSAIPSSTPHALADSQESIAWLAAFQSSQQQLTETHSRFQQAMVESHSAFLRLSESALAGLAAMAAGERPAAMSSPPLATMPMPVSPAASVPVVQPMAAPPGFEHASTPASALPAPAPLPPSASSTRREQGKTEDAPRVDLTALMLQVVAEKTGYPVEMLNLEMDMEGDLGIDSIKRVEILAAVTERAPQLPALDRNAMSALHTLAEIVEYLQGGIGGGEAARSQRTVAALAPLPPSTVAPQRTEGTSAPRVDLTALMLQVVAEKTGYPVEMLNLDMDMEGDLGIDSIKRVEILAAVTERAPQLPALDRNVMSALHTLAEIVGYLQGPLAHDDPSLGLLHRDERRDPPQLLKEASERAPAAAGATPDVDPAQRGNAGRYRIERINAPAAGMAMAGLREAPVWLIGEPTIAGALVTALAAHGIDARIADALPGDATHCVHLGGLRALAGVDDAIAINAEAFTVARQLSRAAGGARLLVCVTDSGGFGMRPAPLHREWLSGLPALIKTAALEWPTASLKAIDIEQAGSDANTLAERIKDELLFGGGEIEVMLDADGTRATLACSAAAAPAGDSAILADEVVLVTGGARGVTAACMIEWARRTRVSLVLLGRSALMEEPGCCVGITDAGMLKRVLLDQARAAGRALTPAALGHEVQQVLATREITRTLAAIRATGARVRYAAVDATDALALRALIDEVRQQWGPIRGVIHAAGVLADKRISEKTDAMFASVFNTKVQGLQALLKATAAEPIKLLGVFSSVSARCGNTGQADYAMANEVLAKVTRAEARRRPGVICKSFGWGPWESGMVTPALRQRFAELGVPMITLAEGARLFVDELCSGSQEVELVLGGEPRPEALLFDGASARVQRLEVSVARSSHAYLEGHAIHGQPVLPLVLAAEWLSRAACSLRPGLPHLSLHDLKVLKGIRLGGFENGGDRFTIEATPLPCARGAAFSMRILDRHGHPNYSARVELRGEPDAPALVRPALALTPWTGAPIYTDLLFHRGAFELIDAMDGISDDGVSASLRGVAHAGWTDEPWQLDVAALDGGLQLAVLFGQRMLGGPNLPTSIQSIRSLAPPGDRGRLSATAYRRTLGATSMTTDILFSDADGQPVAEMLGVSNHTLQQRATV